MKVKFLFVSIHTALAVSTFAHASPVESIVDSHYVKPTAAPSFWSQKQGSFVTLTRSNVDNALYFVGKEQHASNLDGEIDGYVSFAQSHTIAPKGNNDAELPHLVANRQTLLMLTLPTVQEHNQIQATVINATGEELGTVQLLPPRQLPLSDRPTTLE